MEVLDKVLGLLKDGKWHIEVDLKEKLGIPEDKVRLMLNFLEEYKFVERSGRCVKMEHRLIQFLKELEEVGG